MVLPFATPQLSNMIIRNVHKVSQLSNLIDRAGIPQSTGYSSSIESLHSTMLFIKAFFYEAHVIIVLMWPELYLAQCNKNMCTQVWAQFLLPQDFFCSQLKIKNLLETLSA